MPRARGAEVDLTKRMTNWLSFKWVQNGYCGEAAQRTTCRDAYSLAKYLVNIHIFGNIIFNYSYEEYRRNINPEFQNASFPLVN
jgi:hypothetical protein